MVFIFRNKCLSMRPDFKICCLPSSNRVYKKRMGQKIALTPIPKKIILVTNIQRRVKWEGFWQKLIYFRNEIKFCWAYWKESTVSLRTSVLICSQHAQSFIEKSPVSPQNKLSFQKQCSLGLDSRKAVNRRVPDISAYCSISNSTVWPVRPWDVFLLVLKINIFIFMGHVKQNPSCCIASVFYPKQIFISFYSDIRGFLQNQVYSRYFIDFYCHLILCNDIS